MKLFPRFSLFLALVGFFSFGAFAYGRDLSDHHSAQRLPQKYVLDNGLTVLITETPESPMVSVYALIKTGSALEGPYLGSGISHFVEHMLFKGTATREAGEIPDAIQAVGGQINAATGKDYTLCSLTVPADQYPVALNVLADMLRNASFPEKEFNKERDVILNEMKMSEDRPERYLSELSFENIYLNHPYRYRVIGKAALFKKITRDDLIRYYQERYSPNNIILSVSGGVDGAQALQEITQIYGDFPESTPVPRTIVQEPPQITQRQYEEIYPTDMTRVSMAYSGVRLLDKDLFALDVLAGILGQGRSSRLYQDLYETQGLVYEVSAGNYTPVDRGVFEIHLTCDLEKRKQAMDAVFAQVEAIQKSGVTKEELKKIKQQVVADNIFDRETTAQTARHQAFNEAFAGDPLFDDYYVEQIQAVTAQDIKRVARAYLNKTALTVTVLTPPSTATRDNEMKSVGPSVSGAHKYTLSNGLVLVVREEKGLPLVSARLFIRGGRRMETEDTSGLSALMADVWTRGTKSKSAQEISRFVETRGMRLGSYAGLSTIGLKLSFLSRDRVSAFDLLEDVVKHPTFPEKEITRVKEDMKAALAQKGDDIFTFTFDKLRKILYRTHPLRLTPEGTAASIEGLTRQMVQKRYNRLLSPANMVISVCGDVDASAIVDEMERRFGRFTGDGEEVPFVKVPEASLHEKREETSLLAKQQAMVMIGFHGVDIYSPDRYKLEVLAEILGSSFSGRLFQSIREDSGQAYAVGGNAGVNWDVGYVVFYALTSPAAAQDVKAAMFKEIKRLQTEPVEVEEIGDVQNYLVGTHKASLETMDAKAFAVGLDELYGLGLDYEKKYESFVRAVTVEDVQAMAQKYLKENQAAVIVVGPEPANATDYPK